jgi:tRNA C32,U32 (ribose-2'-O)-methylase TrmJ
MVSNPASTAFNMGSMAFNLGSMAFIMVSMGFQALFLVRCLLLLAMDLAV